MDISVFLADFADQFEETDSQMISRKTVFHDLDEWDSLIALAILNMCEKKYGKSITFEEMKKCETVEDLFNIANSK